MRSEKPIYAISRLSDVLPTLRLKQSQSSCDWRRPSALTDNWTWRTQQVSKSGGTSERREAGSTRSDDCRVTAQSTLHNSGGGHRREVCSSQDRHSLSSSDQRYSQLRNCRCEGRGGRPGLPVPNSPYGLCGRKSTEKEEEKVDKYWTWIALCLTARSYRKAEETPILLSCLPQTWSVVAPGNRKYQNVEEWKPKSWRSTQNQTTHQNA